VSGVRVRFAPSPTGSLHLGNARTALFNWLYARRHAGDFILRIEDTDVEREVPGAEAAILEDLAWLGMNWDEGPGVGGPCGPYRQSERRERYGQAASRLLDSGRAYPCFCPPEQLEEERKRQVEAGRTPKYGGRCAGVPIPEARSRLDQGEPAAIRMRLQSFPAVTDILRGRVDFTSREPSDPVLMRRDRRPTYNFAVVVDDAAMGITHVLRGEDHLSNTPVQIRIYEALGVEPPQFGHLPTVLGPDGSPLSKRHGAVSLGEMRRLGYPPEALARSLMLLGWTPPAEFENEPPGLAEAPAHFDLAKVSLSPAAFDKARLDHLGTRVLASLEPRELAVRTLSWIDEARGRQTLAGDGEDLLGWMSGLPPAERWTAAGLAWLGEILGLWSTQACRFADYRERARFVFRFKELLDDSARRAWLSCELGAAPARHVLEALREAVGKEGPVADRAGFERVIALAGGLSGGLRGRPLLHPIRLALTAQESGPELRRLVPLLDGPALACLPVDVLSVSGRVDLVLSMLSATP